MAAKSNEVVTYRTPFCHTEGFDWFKHYVLGGEDGQSKTPEWAKGKCGVPAGCANLDDYCRSIDEPMAIPDLFANQLTEKLQQYFAVGGMWCACCCETSRKREAS